MLQLRDLGFRFQGLGFGFQGLGFGFQGVGMGLTVWALFTRVLAGEVLDLETRVQGWGGFTTSTIPFPKRWDKLARRLGRLIYSCCKETGARMLCGFPIIPGSRVVPFCPFCFGISFLKPNSRKKGTLII